MCATLVEAYRSRIPVIAAPGDGPRDEDEAYAVQRAVWQTMTKASRPTAWKVGAASREACPVAGPIFPHRLGTSPASFPATGFLHFGVEAEIALRFAKNLPPRKSDEADYDRDELLDAVEVAYVAMEIVGTRLADRQAAGPLWRLADNLVNGALVLGDPIADLRRMDAAHVTARSFVDEQLVAESTGNVPLGDIFHCLPWWIRHIGGVRAGDIVTTGTWNGAYWLTGSAELRVELADLGQARATIR